MADFNSLVSKYMDAYGIAETKKADVATTTETKKAGMSPAPINPYGTGAGIITGKGQASAGQMDLDVRTLSPSELSAKYGPQMAQELGAAAVQGMSQFREDFTAERGDRETMRDTAGSAALAFGSGFTGLGSLALGGLDKIGLAPEGAGVWAADKIGDVQTWAQSQQSTALNARRRAGQAVQALDERDHKADAGAEGGGLMSNLRRIGRDTLSSVGNTASDPTLMVDGVASGVGSLYSGGVIGKGVTAAGNAAAARFAVGAAGPSRVGAMIAQATDKAAMPIAIGALEGGGAYQQTADQAVAMGADTEDANSAGLLAAGIQAPIGMLTGALVSKFEAAPTNVRSLGSAASNILRETVEEGIQSGSGQASQNYGLKTYVDPNQDLAEGVGAQVGQGALFGMGTAGALQAPGVAIHGAVETGKAGRELGIQAKDAIMGRGEKILSGLKAEEAQRATDLQSAAVASAPEAQQQVKDAILARGLSPEETTKQTDYVDRVFANMSFDPAETQAEAPVVQAATQGATDRFTALRQVAQVANDPSTSETDRAQAGAYLLKQYSQYQGLLEGDLREAILQVDDSEGSTDPNLQHLDKLFELEAVVGGLREHPEIADALAKAQEAASSKAVANQFNDKAMSTPEGQQAAQASAQAVIELAGIDPAKADPEMLEVIRAHAVAGRLQLTPEQRGILTTASILIRTTREILEQKKALGLTYSDEVTQDIQTREQASNPLKQSATRHARGVLAALRVGDRDLARTSLQDFMLFAQHMQNKVDALNISVSSGSNQPYTALSPKRNFGEALWYKDTAGLGLKLHDERSVQFAQQTALDARAVASLANGVAAAFPELGIQSVTPVALGIDPDLNRKATDVVKEHQEKKKATPKEEIKPEKVAEERPTEKVEPTPKETQEVKSETKAATELDPDQQPPPFEKPVEPLKEAEQPLLPLASDEATDVPAEPEQFADLVGSADGKNWFKKAFRSPKVAKSRLIGMGDGMATAISGALASAAAFEKFLGYKASNKLTPEISRAYQAYLATASEVEAEMARSLASFLAKNDITKAKPGNPAQQWVRAKVLNVVRDEDGKLSYHPELLQASVLAGLQWLLTTGSRPAQSLDEEDVGKILGVAPTEVPDGAVDFFNEGVSVTDAKQGLADIITRFWGQDTVASAPLGYTKGIPEAVAANLLKSMEAAGLIQLSQDKFGEGENSRTFNRVDVAKDEELLAALATMNAFPSAIEQLALVEPEETRFIGAPPKRVPEFQMRNRLVRNTEQQKEAIRAEQDTPHLVNTNMVSFLETLGEDLVVELFGAGEIDEAKFNKNHALSLKGKNASIRGAYKSLVGMMAEVRNKAEAAGVEASELPIHYEYNVSRVGRLHMLGLHNPQSSKLMREAILPTRSTIDLSDRANRDKFMLAVAQAWGVKVHKQVRDLSVAEAYSLARGKFAPAISLLETFMMEKGKALSKDDIAVLKGAFGDKLSTAAVHAAMEFVRFNTQEDRTNFTTDLYVEADGVTDGPVNALVHIATGSFSAKWVDLVAKGGLFLGAQDMTVNEFVSQGGEAARDLYQATTDAFDEKMGQFVTDITDPKVRAQMGNLLTAMDGLLGSDLSFDGETEVLSIERGMAKNPLTVTIYGSGALGIADKITGAMTTAFYGELSKAAQGLPNQAEKLKVLIKDLSTTVVANGEKGLFTKNVSRETEAPRNVTNQGYTLTQSQMKNLRQNVMELFVTPLRNAIEATIEDTGAGRTSLREAVQVQSIFLEHAFIQMVEQKLTEKKEADPDFKRSDFLSTVELEEIYTELKAMSPLVDTGTQTFFVAGSERTDIELTEFSRSLDGDLSTPAYVHGPKDAGVAGIPYLVIGPGDGQMMQNLATMKGAPKGTLKVFDGVHLKLDTLDEDGLTVNQSVYDAWQNSSLSAVNASFQSFLQNVSLSDMPAGQIESLKKALFSPKEREGASEQDIAARVREIGSNLKRLSEEAQARHNALARVQMSVDHMASVETPFQSEGESLEGMASDAIASRLNELVAEELEKIRAPKAERKVSDPATEPLAVENSRSDASSEDTPPATSSGPEVLGREGLKRLANRLVAPAELKNLLREAARSLGSGWEIVRGTPEQTSAYAISKGQVPHYGRPGDQLNGYMDPNQQRIYLHTDSVETLLHEVLHALVTQKIVDHYQGNSTPEVTETIAHLETLMSQWMALGDDLSGFMPEQRRAYNNAFSQVKAELNTAGRSSAQNKAAALDEFLAWNLSNQELIKIAQGTKVANPIARVVKRVLVALKNLIWGRKMAPMVRSDMYSALRFNASVLINSTPTLQSRASKATRFQSVAYGNSARLTELHEKLNRKLYNLLNEQPTPTDRVLMDKKIHTISGDLADRVYSEFESNGFRMTPQEHLAFVMMLTVFATQAKLDPAALSRAQELFAHVNKTLTVEDFMSDPTSQDPNMRLAAQKKFSVIKGIDYRSGRSIVQHDDYGRSTMVLAGNVDKGRSTLLPAFLALAAVNDEFREVLAKLSLPKSEVRTNDTLDNVATNAANNLLDGLSRKLSGEGRGRANVQEAIDALTDRLAANVEGQENMISQLVNPVARGINGLNHKFVGVMQKTSKALIEKAEEAQAQTNNKYAKGVLEVGKGIIAIANESEAKKLAEGLISTINQLKIFQPAHDFLNDLIGRTESNAPVYDLIKRVRSMVQQMRQQFREHLPGLIAQRFSRELTKEEWGDMFKGLARTDLAALAQTFNVQQVLDMLKDPRSQEAEIRRLEDLIESEAGQDNWRLIEKKARQLAVYMNTGVPGSHLLRNSQAVAGLFGVLGARPYTPTPALVGRLDQLISLYALEGLDSSTKNALTSLVQDEAEGMAFTLSYLVGQRTAELAKVNTDKARVNHYKGYVPSEPQGGAQLLVANDSESTRLIQLGYKRAGKYAGSLIEPGLQPKSYWFAPVSSRALFQQGIMQNVRQTASGVDPVTGHSHGPMTAGRIVDPRVVRRLARYSNGAQLFEPLLPIFDKDGEVIAFERSVDPAQELRLNRDTHLARMIGVWRGRQAEESLAGDFNKLLINQLHNVWTTSRTEGRANEFVDLMDPDFLKSDPVAKDAVSLFTPDALEHIRETFGGDGFKVRRDMLNDAIGYRSPSVGDLWTGNTRLHPDAADTAKRLVVGVFGVNAYRNLVTAEKLTQNLVSEARQLIVVKSVIVPVSNFIANIYQMASRGVNLGRIARDVPKKLVEVNAYVQRRQRQIELEAELWAAENNVVEARRINAEFQSILDANKRMTIWPLIEAGEFSSISDAGSLDKKETTLFEGNLTQYIEQKVDKLPKGIRTAGKYALITQDTALFQGMRRAMEYGDFLAKAVTYDHLTQEKKLNTTEALARITEEYVNYDRLSGRFRTYIENMGLLWFWNFKVRIAKIAVATIRDNPVQALLTTLMPTPDFVGSIGTPMSDNLFTIGVDGDLGWSMGPGMGFRSYEMNPWIALVK